MSENISKYSQAQDIGTTIFISDSVSPYSYRTWLERSQGILPGKERQQYEKYVRDWYNEKEQTKDTKQLTKENYIQLLKQLAITFKSDAEANWVSDIDFTDDNDIVQAIPFYVTKLKEIAIYLINKREAVQRAKLKYNLTGTYASLERLFYEYLLKAFTRKRFTGNEYATNITDVSVLESIPELSAVTSSFQILVDELYDDASYFDRDPTMPVSAYFTINDSATAFLNSLNISPKDIEWLYTTGVSNICADNPLLWSVDNMLNQYKSGIPLSAVELYESDLLNDYNRINLAKKYLGEKQYILSGGYWIPWVSNISYGLNTNNNWFYWISGENAFEMHDSTSIDPIKINQSSLIDSGATAGNSIENSDIIFATRNNSITGAWLQLSDKSTLNVVMTARLDRGKTVFSFPYPGYGLSGEDLDWTGRSLDNIDRTFLYLTPTEKQAVLDTYWETSLLTSASSFDPIYINDTTLAIDGAGASDSFDYSDYITVRNSLRDGKRDGVYTGIQEYAWLYKMSKTDIPIAVGENSVYWPFERYNGNIKMLASVNQCDSIPLSSISMQCFSGAVAGGLPDNSDILFRRSSPNATEYIEGAWLKGNTLTQPKFITTAGVASSYYQPNLNMQIFGGKYGSFIWAETTNQSADSVFINSKHQNDCKYLTQKQFSLFKERPTQGKELKYNQWQDCNCGAILYSPLGHPGYSFDEYEGMSDFIIALVTPISSFNFKDWRGTDNKDYTTSRDFGWYRLDSQNMNEPDVGWSSGKWVNNDGVTSFILSADVMYLYYRNDMHRDTPSVNVPYYICKHKYNNQTKNVWVKLAYNKIENKWVDANTISDMVIKPGDILQYIHPSTTSIVLTSFHYEYNIREVPVIPDFKTFAMESTLHTQNLLTSTVNLTLQELVSTTGGGIDVVDTSTIPLSYHIIDTTKPTTLSATFENMSPQTVTTTMSTITSIVIDYYTYTNNSINFILNIPLTNSKPFWAAASDNNDNSTKNKSIDIWSGSPVLVDEYNFITQPSFSNIALKNNMYIEYTKRSLGSIFWKQPVVANVDHINKKWCTIEINKTGISNLSATLNNNINELIVSATNTRSELVLDTVQDNPLMVNYFARNPFTWVQEISNSSLGLPPTGGVWIPIGTNTLIDPDIQYAHISNRHFPTYASAPSIGDLYSVKDVGGYNIPKMLGASVAVSKNINNVLDTSNIDNDQDKRGVSCIYRNIDIFDTDRGLSRNDQHSPIKHISTDSSWMKADITEGDKAGIIINSEKYQELMPYQTAYETVGSNNNGIYRQGQDSYDPWYGDEDITWENPSDWPVNWRGQYDIRGWYEQLDKGSLQVYQWKTDIFGNQYALLKGSNFQTASIYDKKHTIPGQIWTRDARNVIQSGDVSLREVFRDIPPPELSMTGGYTLDGITYLTGGILDIDIWFDTLMLYTSSGLYFYHLNFDYDKNVIYSTADETNFIITQNSLFGGTWFHEQDKLVTICTLLSCGDQIRPVLRQLNLETNHLNTIFTLSSDLTDMSVLNLNSYDHPVFTYDYKTKTYNVSYLGYSTDRSGMHLTTINIRNYGSYYDIYSIKTITPNA